MSMTYDQLYTSDEFRLIAGCVSADDRNHYHAWFSGRLEAFQSCSGGWPGSDRPLVLAGSTRLASVGKDRHRTSVFTVTF